MILFDNQSINSMILSSLGCYQAELKLSTTERAFLLTVCRDIFARQRSPNTHQTKLPTPPARLMEINPIAFVSICNRYQTQYCVAQEGNNLYERILASAQAAVTQTLSEVTEGTYFQVDILYSADTLSPDDYSSLTLGLDSVGINYKNKITLLKSDVAIKRELTTEQFIAALFEKAGLEQEQAKQAQWFKFKTLSFREDILNTESPYGLHDLYRANELILQSEVTLARVTESKRMALTYLENILINPDTPIYRYNPISDNTHTPQNKPELIRCLASLWSYLECSDENKINFSKEHFYSQLTAQFNCGTGADKTNPGHAFTDLGTTALFIICDQLINPSDPTLRKKAISTVLHYYHGEQHIFFTHSINGENKIDKAASLTLPFMAMIALLRESANYLQLVESTFETYLNKVNLDSPELFVQSLWIVRVIAELNRYKKNTELIMLAVSIGYKLCKTQLESTNQEVDLYGAFGKPTYTINTASILETLSIIATELDLEPSIQKHFTDAIFKGARFLMQMQYTPLNSFNKLAIGALRNSPWSNEVRIDCVQHAVFSFSFFLKLIVTL